MRLEEDKKPTELIKKAMADGIETVEEYSIWIVGYMTGSTDIMKDVASTFEEGFPSFADEVTK